MVAILTPLMGCIAAGYKDDTQQVARVREISAPPDVELTDVAWLDDDHVAYIRRYRRGDYRIALFSLSRGTWREIVNMPINEHCHPGSSSLAYLRRLPNGNLGYGHNCSDEGQSGFIYEWDIETETSRVLYFYESFFLGPYSFSPDMLELIQEHPVGRGLNNELYLARETGKMTQLFPDYQRTSNPSWSPNGDLIAFAGTEQFPFGDSEDFKSWREIESGLQYPWDIYLVDADGGDQRTVLSDVRNVDQFKWSPTNRNLISFAGNPFGRNGIWTLDIDNSELTLIWPQRAPYDWSPDAKKMAIIRWEGQGEVERTSPIVIDVPFEVE